MKILNLKIIFLIFIFTIVNYLVPFVNFSVFAQESSSSALIATPTPRESPVPTAQPSTSTGSPLTNQSESSSAITTPLPLTNNSSGESASIRLALKILPLSKKQFLISEPIQIEVLNTYDETPKIYVLTDAGREVPFFYKEIKPESANRKFQIISAPNLSPGKYMIQVSISSGFVTSDAFLWGTLFVNSDKSSYEPGEKANLGIGLADENGQKVCDADIDLKSQSTNAVVASTSDNSIIRNADCRNHTPTSKPDYETSVNLPDTEGTYKYWITASIQGKEPQMIEENIEVAKNPFEVERSAPSRLFPHATYPVKLTIKANQDFNGIISDLIPASFSLINSSGSAQLSSPVSTDSAYFRNYSLYKPLEFNLGKPFDGIYTLTQGFGGHLDKEYARFDYTDFGLSGHDGIDFGLPEGTPLKAADSGVVVHAGLNPYGKTVIIDHSWGKTYYGHLNVIYVTENQKVSKGDIIGLSGNTGFSTGPHLHFGILPNVTNPNNGFFGKMNALPFLGMSKDGQLLKNFPHLFDTNSQKISWRVNLKAGDSTELTFMIQSPAVSPQTYFLGPVKFESELVQNSVENISTQSAIILSDPAASSSGIILTPTPPAVLKKELSFQDNSLWTAVSDTQIQVDDSVHFSPESHEGPGSNIVFTTTQTGYIFFRDLSGRCVYSQTVDGGNTWKKQSSLAPFAGCLNISVWYDRQTPQDKTGKFIHVVMTDKDSNRIYYNRLDSETNSLLFTGNPLNITDTFPNTFSLSQNIPSIVRNSDGSLYVGLLDNDGAGSSFVLRCSSDCQNSGNWIKLPDPGLPADKTEDELAIQPLSDSRLLLLHLSFDDKKIFSKEYNSQKNVWEGDWKEAASGVDNPALYSWNTLKDPNSDEVYLASIQGGNINLASYHTGQWDSLPAILENTPESLLSVKLGFDPDHVLYAVYSARQNPDLKDSISLFYKASSDNKIWSVEKGPLNIFEGALSGIHVTSENSDRLRAIWIDPETMTLYMENLTGSQSLEKKMRNSL